MCSIKSAPVFVPNQFKEFAHILVTIDVSEQVQQEQAWRVMTRGAVRGITFSHKRADKGKIDQRSKHSTHAALDVTVWKDFNKAFFKAIV